ncbi:alcohol dehydrogenase [Subtercola boreus]|uniref:Alcohol dehydrogenase n=1 Tax=Subtercola boreus TaxID=120213 RepID=A0A3E0VXJ4_9MICO|nr:alcohol dehydrogenase catalytic domain-containing protein [Subtercola boreus]RFA14606.1 alcohol dehydrogenase [Subtercola boreus]
MIDEDATSRRGTVRGAVLSRIGSKRPYSVSRPLEIRRVQLDAPGATEIEVRIEVASLCHSDLSVVSGVRPRPVPMLLGHEAAGIVEVVGSEVVGVSIGDRVVMTFLPRCEECAACASGGASPCERGSASNGEGTLLSGGIRIHDDEGAIFHHLGVSGFAERSVVDYRSVVVVDQDVPPDVAALMGCAVLTGGGAVLNTGQLVSGERLAVMGLGGVGMAALLVGLAHDGVTVIGIDVHADKLETARGLGAHEVYTPTEAAELGITADLVVEAVGRAVAFEAAVAMTAIGGRTVTAGLPAPDDLASISPLALVAGARRILGSYLGGSVPKRDIPRFVDLWRAGRLPVESLVSSEVSLENINGSMDALADGHVLRQIIRFDQAPTQAPPDSILTTEAPNQESIQI